MGHQERGTTLSHLDRGWYAASVPRHRVPSAKYSWPRANQANLEELVGEGQRYLNVTRVLQLQLKGAHAVRDELRTRGTEARRAIAICNLHGLKLKPGA